MAAGIEAIFNPITLDELMLISNYIEAKEEGISNWLTDKSNKYYQMLDKLNRDVDQEDRKFVEGQLGEIENTLTDLYDGNNLLRGKPINFGKRIFEFSKAYNLKLVPMEDAFKKLDTIDTELRRMRQLEGGEGWEFTKPASSISISELISNPGLTSDAVNGYHLADLVGNIVSYMSKMSMGDVNAEADPLYTISYSDLPDNFQKLLKQHPGVHPSIINKYLRGEKVTQELSNALFSFFDDTIKTVMKNANVTTENGYSEKLIARLHDMAALGIYKAIGAESTNLVTDTKATLEFARQEEYRRAGYAAENFVSNHGGEVRYRDDGSPYVVDAEGKIMFDPITGLNFVNTKSGTAASGGRYGSNNPGVDDVKSFKDVNFQSDTALFGDKEVSIDRKGTNAKPTWSSQMQVTGPLRENGTTPKWSIQVNADLDHNPYLQLKRDQEGKLRYTFKALGGGPISTFKDAAMADAMLHYGTIDYYDANGEVQHMDAFTNDAYAATGNGHALKTDGTKTLRSYSIAEMKTKNLYPLIYVLAREKGLYGNPVSDTFESENGDNYYLALGREGSDLEGSLWGDGPLRTTFGTAEFNDNIKVIPTSSAQNDISAVLYLLDGKGINSNVSDSSIFKNIGNLISMWAIDLSIYTTAYPESIAKKLRKNQPLTEEETQKINSINGRNSIYDKILSSFMFCKLDSSDKLPTIIVFSPYSPEELTALYNSPNVWGGNNYFESGKNVGAGGDMELIVYPDKKGEVRYRYKEDLNWGFKGNKSNSIILPKYVHIKKK